MTATVHTATDYAAAAWLNLPIPKFFSEKMTAIDTICATKALGALKNSPSLFLRHDLDLKNPEVQLTSKILNTVAIIAAKPPSHPLYHVYGQARSTRPQAHKNPLHAFFQPPLAETFSQLLDLQQPDSTIPLPSTQNFTTLINPEKDKAINAIQDLRTSKAHIIVYSDGPRIEGKNTAAAAWCENNGHLGTLQLGKDTDYGIFEAEFSGLVLALQLAKHSFQITTQRVTLILDNQGVVKDMSTKKTSLQALNKKIEAIDIIKEIEEFTPHVKIASQWCPGLKGIIGNENADQLANQAAKKPLPRDHADKPTFASFRLAIKDWAEKESIKNYSPQDIKHLGHQPRPKQHLKALTTLKNKHSVSSITQLRSGHIPLYQYLAERNLRADPTCECPFPSLSW